MRTDDFNYDLPVEYIAQTPVEPRDHSRLMVIDRKSNGISHHRFYELDELLKPGDLMVMNQTRVIPARIIGHKKTGGRVEILLLRKQDETTWLTLVGGKGLRTGVSITLDNGPECEIIAELAGSQRLVKFSETVEPYFPVIGHTPLPPYIHEDLSDPERYQTIYARVPGSAAAPTAGLHFTDELLKRLLHRQINIGYVTLHVGLDTFAPVTENDPEEHTIHTEWCQVTKETCEMINRTRREGGRIIAVGTTTVRTLESAAFHSGVNDKTKILLPYSSDTGLFILPGYKFKIVDAMITNFHLPKSTLIMLVSAFAGKELILNAYEVAKKEKYRFYSFGDAMVIL
jgi:S-adenosylmethionine:tRNA ribosyltransferase-isomerase